MKRESLDCAHVERGGEEGGDKVGHGDGFGHLREVILVQEDEVVYGCDVTVPGEKKPGSSHQHTDVDQMKPILWFHTISHLTKGVSCMERGTHTQRFSKTKVKA